MNIKNLTPSQPITPCGLESHEWENDEHDDGHIEARCIVCLCWLGDVVGHAAAAGDSEAA